MFEGEGSIAARNGADNPARASPADQRKELGQYFTGLTLGKLLAHLALGGSVRTVLDPMAGDGDLLEAAWQAATEQGVPIQRLDGMEIDEAMAQACRARLNALGKDRPAAKILAGDAFCPKVPKALPERSYDLVIANPPYVRYQSRNGNGERARAVRAGLKAIVSDHVAGPEAMIWRCLVDGYSGLADLSIPAWILAAAMVRPGGRLALVVSSTWRSRDYADAVRYLMLRCFRIECVVEDMHASWFADAQVRTHLVVARRLSAVKTAKLLAAGDEEHPVWARIATEAGNRGSLVGAAFPGAQPPERGFATWLRDGCVGAKPGIEIRSFDLQRERGVLEQRLRRHRWHRVLNGRSGALPVSAQGQPAVVPEALADLLPDGCPLRNLEDAGIFVGQGLRTGCNDFFYVTVRAARGRNAALVEASALFDACCFVAPNAALRPVLRRQAELGPFANGDALAGRVLDLRSFILPEDRDATQAAQVSYARNGDAPPCVMTAELAAHVRCAAVRRVGRDGKGKPIPMLSAVYTNGRAFQGGRRTPRFWYMLPDFAPRHLPAAFVPRINHLLPWAEANRTPPLLIDANFCTFWAHEGSWTGHAIKALLNSIWCRVAMEALGTPMGGGALKLEATHLRNLPIPMFSGLDQAELDAAGKQLVGKQPSAQQRIDEIVLRALHAGLAEPQLIAELATAIEVRAASLMQSRRRRRPAARQAFA